MGASFLLAIMPGPDNILVMTESLTKSAKNGVALALGMNSGVLIHTIAAATGISLILQQSELAFTIVKILGALYLLYLAYAAFVEDSDVGRNVEDIDVVDVVDENEEVDLTVAENRPSENIARLFKQGFVMNVLNPKVSLFFIALLPQFLTDDGYVTMYQMIILGAIFMIIGAIVFSAIALLAGHLKGYIQDVSFWNKMKWLKIGVLLLIASSLLFF
jgi:threonine/homoserine/homoserine lactone efflux protein